MKITVAEAHNRLSHWLKKAQECPIVISRRGKAVGVILSSSEYEQLSRLRAYLKVLQLSHTIANSGIGAEELYRSSRQELEDRS